MSKRPKIRSHLQILPRYLNKNILFHSLALLIILFTGYKTKKMADRFIAESSHFRIKNLEILIGQNKKLTGTAAFNFCRLQMGSNIFKISPREVAEKVAEIHPELYKVKVVKIMPDSLKIVAQQRQPVFQLKLAEYYPVDNEGFVLPYARNFRYKDLPLVEGINFKGIKISAKNSSPKIKLALQLVSLTKDHIPEFLHKLRIDLSSVNNILIYLKNCEVRLGTSERLQEKFLKLKQVLQDIDSKGISPRYIDLRFERVILGPE